MQYTQYFLASWVAATAYIIWRDMGLLSRHGSRYKCKYCFHLLELDFIIRDIDMDIVTQDGRYPLIK